MYSLSQVRRGFSSPNLFFREANRLYHRRLNTRPYNTNGIDIFEEDWDNLLILDACRYDMMEKCSLRGTLESRISRGSCTPEFLRGNFDGKELLDTVYVTANPKLYENRDNIDVTFHDIVNIWQEGWDDDRETVLPETTTEFAKKAAKKYPEKRLLVHYIQPHYPFIGTDKSPFKKEQAFTNPNEPGSWHQQFTGQISAPREQIWQAYIETLEYTIPSVNELLDTLAGKSVVSADHGNMVGERAWPFPIQEWGHPLGIYTDQLVEVPWLVQETEDRRTIQEEPPEESQENVDDDVVKERLRQLGYAD